MWQAIKKALGFPTEAEKVAKVAFRSRYPEQIVRSKLAADESSRYVVGIFYDWGGKPNRYRFYAVDKATMVAEELSDSAHRPKIWR